MIGDHTHVFWDCPKMRTFWKNIKQETEDILRTDLLMDPLLFLLHLYPKDLHVTYRTFCF